MGSAYDLETIRDDVLSVEQVSVVLKVIKKTVYCLLKAGAIKHIKIGRQFRIPKKYLFEFLYP